MKIAKIKRNLCWKGLYDYEADERDNEREKQQEELAQSIRNTYEATMRNYKEYAEVKKIEKIMEANGIKK